MSEIQGIVRFEFHEGMVEEFKRLSAQLMEIVRRQDTGTLLYETYLNEDESEALVLQRFRDSEALLEHEDHIAELVKQIIATGTITGALCGELSPEMRARIKGDNPQIFRLYTSM